MRKSIIKKERWALRARVVSSILLVALVIALYFLDWLSGIPSQAIAAMYTMALAGSLSLDRLLVASPTSFIESVLLTIDGLMPKLLTWFAGYTWLNSVTGDQLTNYHWVLVPLFAVMFLAMIAQVLRGQIASQTLEGWEGFRAESEKYDRAMQDEGDE